MCQARRNVLDFGSATSMISGRADPHRCFPLRVAFVFISQTIVPVICERVTTVATQDLGSACARRDDVAASRMNME
jgi:hypothetical protein